MGSWSEELDRREAAARERIGSLRRQIAELTEPLAAEENLLSRLEITRETMTEISPGRARPASRNRARRLEEKRRRPRPRAGRRSGW